MQFGHFDDAKKEYVIDRPDTPKSWTNYLGTTRYGSVISNNAGGYSFFKCRKNFPHVLCQGVSGIAEAQVGLGGYVSHLSQAILHQGLSVDFLTAGEQELAHPVSLYSG